MSIHYITCKDGCATNTTKKGKLLYSIFNVIHLLLFSNLNFVSFTHICILCVHMDMPQSRCSPKKFFKIMGMLTEEKKQAITTLGFGGLLQLSCREVRFNLCHWIITHYNVLHHCVVLGPNKLVNITVQDVNDVLGVPSKGIVINFVN